MVFSNFVSSCWLMLNPFPFGYFWSEDQENCPIFRVSSCVLILSGGRRGISHRGKFSWKITRVVIELAEGTIPHRRPRFELSTSS